MTLDRRHSQQISNTYVLPLAKIHTGAKTYTTKRHVSKSLSSGQDRKVRQSHVEDIHNLEEIAWVEPKHDQAQANTAVDIVL